MHPDVIMKSFSVAQLQFDNQGQFEWNYDGCEAEYDWVGNLAVHLLVQHQKLAMTFPFGCGASFGELQQVEDHFDNQHTKLLAPQKHGSEVKYVKSMEEFLASNVFQISDFAKVVKDRLEIDLSTVFFVDVETTMTL